MNLRKFPHFVPVWAVLALAGVGLAACSGRDLPEPVTLSDGQCMGLADSIKTLRRGDPLPRAVQVVGQPARSYRVTAPFGDKYDVLEYDVGGTPCARMVLNSPKRMQLMFDAYGGYMGAGRDKYLTLQRASMVRLNGIPVDINAYND